MWWVIGARASFIVLFCYCSCVLAGRADEKKSEWLSREEECTLKLIPPEREFRDAHASGIQSAAPPEPSALLPFGSSLVGLRKNI
jgi:hypothetical protein